MNKVIRAVVLTLSLAVAVQATPVTIEEFFLVQDPPTGTVTIIESQECCEDKAGVPWWPFLFAGAIPLAFIDRSDQILPPDLLIPPTTTPTPETTPVPEPPSIALGLLAFAGLFIWRKRR